jgi:hypothetical protein
VHGVEAVLAVPRPKLAVLLLELLLDTSVVQIPKERDVGLRGGPERHLVPDGVLLEHAHLVSHRDEQQLGGVLGAHQPAHHLHQSDEPRLGYPELQQGMDRPQLRLQLVAARQVDCDLHVRIINAK